MLNKSIVIHKLHVIGPNGATNLVSRVIPLHQHIKWIEFDEHRNSLQITYMNNEVDVYICMDGNNKSLKDAVNKLLVYSKDNINL